MSNDQPSPDCHECGGSGTNAASLPCSVCHRKANLAARRHPVSDSVVLVNASGSKYVAFVEAIADGDLPGGLLATTGQPGPYSAAAVEATVDHLRQRIRELEVDRDAFRDSALAAESILRQGSDALARILGRDEGLPLALHLPTVRLIVAGLQEAQRERDDLREAARSVVAAFDDLKGSQVVACGICDGLALTYDNGGKTRCGEHANGGEDLTYAPAWRRLVGLVKP